MAIASFVWLALLAIPCYLILSRAYRRWTDRSLPLPPCPPKDPLIGHLRYALVPEPHNKFYELGKTFGEVIHLNTLGRITIIVNNLQKANDLLDKRSANYSDRFIPRALNEMGWTESLPFLRYGKSFQTHRRLFMQHFSKAASAKYLPVQLREARIFAQKLATGTVALNIPEMEQTISTFVTTIIVRIVSGYQITSPQDPYIKLSREVSAALAQGGAPGGSLLDFLPFLEYMPRWFPGTFYAYYARDNLPKVKALYDYLFNDVSAKLAAGNAKSSIMTTQLETLRDDDGSAGYNVDDVKGAGAIAYAAGADTTSSSMWIFFLAMVLYPEAQARAQEELDGVLKGRLPDFEDRPSLPYLESLLHELHRWHHPLPSGNLIQFVSFPQPDSPHLTGVPHRSLEDDVYEGMFIPKDSVIIANIRSMTWDEDIYSNPRTFNPSRFLPKPQGLEEPIPTATWGFGRRVCPGRHLADATLWISIATMLATFKITTAVGKDGKEIIPEEVFQTSVSSRPRSFPFVMKPRSKAALDVIMGADTSEYY
ncbi:hypothetical protein H0H92_000710 [Tricholoma furcatifolium]|nr:hypothetical protein H0H92_000710 [Tricholoma furcatifolium]